MREFERNALIIGGCVALYFIWKGYQGAEAVVTKYANPAHQDNVVNQGVSAVGEAITGKKDWSLGVHIYNTVDSIQDALPFMDSDREKRQKLEDRYRALYRSQNSVRNNYNALPEIF